MYGVGFGYGAIGATTKRSSGAAFNYLLDTYSGSSVAYSLRKLSSTYSGSCIRVRRSSDNAEQNIGFNGDVLDTASLLSFVGANSGYVVTWYDQSGNANNITQSTAISQPMIVSAGSLIYENSKIAIEYNDSYMTGGYELTDDTNFLLSGVLRINTSNTTSHPRIGAFVSTANSVNLQYGYNTSNQYFVRKDSETKGTTAQTNILSLQYNLIYESVSNTINVDRNNSLLTSATTTAPGVNTGFANGIHLFKGYTTTGGYINTGNIQEFILWPSNQSSNKSLIKTNINNFYGIY